MVSGIRYSKDTACFALICVSGNNKSFAFHEYYFKTWKGTKRGPCNLAPDKPKLNSTWPVLHLSATADYWILLGVWVFVCAHECVHVTLACARVQGESNQAQLYLHSLGRAQHLPAQKTEGFDMAERQSFGRSNGGSHRIHICVQTPSQKREWSIHS